jgi:uncharacterized membrane-anchored protein
MGKNTREFLKGDVATLSYNPKKDTDQILTNQQEQDENSNSGEKSPEFDVLGTALNDLHSPFDF